jgi:hypothetical protein
MPYSPQ